MSTAIGVTARDLLVPVMDRTPAATVVLGPPGEQSLDEAVSAVSAVLDAVGHLVVVVPAALPGEHRTRLRTVRSLLESARTALVEVDLPPLALALLVRQLRQIAPYDLGPGVIASAARLLAHYLHAGAVLGSVARLDRIEVGFGAHLKSLVPGTRFAVLATPRPVLEPLAGRTRLPGPQYATELAHTGGGPDEQWVTGRLGVDWKCRAVRQLALPRDSARWWGTGRLVEFAAYIADVGMLYRLVTSAHRAPCEWCGLERIGDRCGFCATGGPPQAAPAHRRTG